MSPMSAPSSNPPNVSYLQFQDLFDVALREYKQKTGKDIATHPLTARFLDCKSPDAVLAILEEQARAFDQFRNGDWKVQLMRRLKPTVYILLGLSTSDVVVEGISLVRLPRSSYPLWQFIIHPVEISTSEGNICWCWSPTHSMYSSSPESAVLTPKCLRPLRELALAMMHLLSFLDVSNITSAVSKSSLRSPSLWERYRSK